MSPQNLLGYNPLMVFYPFVSSLEGTETRRKEDSRVLENEVRRDFKGDVSRINDNGSLKSDVS